ncbi:MAG: hypothetical protein V7641_2801 [Blastocatellia bacterium]
MSVSVHPSPSAEPKPVRVRPDEVARRCALPNGSERIEVYGLDGRLHRSQEPDGTSIAFRYDIDGELRSVEHSLGERVSYESLSEPKLLGAKSDRCETVVEFDASGFPARLIQRVDEFEWSVQYRRDEIGRVLACLYPQALDWLQSTGSQEGDTVSTDVAAGSHSYFRGSVGPQAQQIAFADGTRTVQSTGPGMQLEKITCYNAQGSACLANEFEMEQQRLTHAGQQRFTYDEAGRLVGCAGPDQHLGYEYDEAGRLVAVRSFDQVTELGYADHPAPVRVNDETLTYDALGRRTSRAETSYRYNFFGQLTEVVFADGTSVRYVYDGFGRLVARECGDERVYYVVDFEGHRICEAAADGRVRRCYLWQGANCIADIEGVIGDPLSHSFHRGHGGRLQAMGLSGGEIALVAAGDPYGADQIRVDGIPSFGSLFADPATGLYHAGSRWFDPLTAQFLTPDGWFGTDAWNHLPQAMRSVFDALPGGTNVVNTPDAAYAWCRYDPVNYSDPNGHSAATGFGIFYSIISFFLWQMQVTSIALQMAALNFVIMIIPSIINGIYSAATGKPMWGVNIFNAIAPFLASSRLMVPWSFPLNSLYNAPGTVFTMGSVIWMRGSQHRGLDKSAKRDILVCDNAADYLASGSVAADVFAVARPAFKGTGTMNATADHITAANLDAGLAPATLATVFLNGDPIGIRKAGGGQEEYQMIQNIAGADIELNRALPADLANAAVEFFRLDRPMVKIEKDGRTIARSIAFVRGKSIHYQNQLPDGFPESGLKASEYLFKSERKRTRFTGNSEFLLIEFSDADIASYSPNDFLSILSGSSYFGRKMVRKQGARNLILDAALPPGGAPPGTPPLDTKVEVAVMTATAEPALNTQSSSTDKITVGAMRTLRKHDGLTIAVGGGAVEDRRIVLQMFLRCTVDNLPATLLGKPLKLDLLTPDVTRGNGKVTTADTVTVGKNQAKAFKDNQPVRITAAPGKEFSAIIKKVTAAAETIQLAENLPGADFTPGTTAVTVVLLKAFKTLDSEPAVAPGGTVEVKSDDLASPVADDLLLVRPATGADAPVLRKVKGDPVVVAQLDSAPTHNANLTVQAFSADAAKTHKGEAKRVVLRLTPTAPPHTYAQNDEIYCRAGSEEYIGKNIAAPGGDLMLEDPISTPGFDTAPFEARLVEPTNKTTAAASLDESLIAIPSDPDEDPVKRGRAVELHEMRHVWQYAVVGPFFFSQPLPWLFHLGFAAIGGEAAGLEAHKWTRWFSLGILDKLFSVIAWGIGGAKKDTSASATIANAERTRISFDAQVSVADAEQFTKKAPIEVALGDKAVFNIVDEAAPNERRIDLRFPLEKEFTQGTAVKVTVSPFEKINSSVNKFFDLNLAQIWGDYIPTAWGRALNGFLNRENWFPLLGLYPIALLRAGGKQSKMYFEQDASFQSGDLYTPFGVSYPNEIFVGEFSRVLAFIEGRGFGDLATGVSGEGNAITSVLTVEPKNLPAGKTARDLIIGSASAGGTAVRFRKEFMLPMNEKVENVVGAMFLTNTAGEYKVLSMGASLDDMVDPALWLPPFIPFFPASFNELRIIKVKPLGLNRVYTDADPLFETEETTFVIKGAEQVTYTIDYKGAPPAVRGAINKLTFTAPVLGGPKDTHHLAITSKYGADHAIFKSKGKLHEKITLPAASLTNVCQDLDIVIAPITVDAAPTVKAGGSTQFKASLSPKKIELISANIPEAKVQASLASPGGRPAMLAFRAPSKVNAAKDVKFRLTFGTPPRERPIEVTIHIEP